MVHFRRTRVGVWAAALGAACGVPTGAPTVGGMISGGTLVAWGEDQVIALDPDGQVARRWEVVGGLREVEVTRLGGRPRRAAVGADDRVWVVLDDAVGWFWPGGRPFQRARVCRAPRGVLPDGDGAWVACAEGSLVRVDAELEVQERVPLADDLRDVVRVGEALWVSRFRAAEIVEVVDGRVTRTLRPPPGGGRATEPAVAWRMVASSDGVYLAHQRVDPTPVPLDRGLGSPPYGGPGCDAVVQSAVTWWPADGGPARTTALLDRLAVPVDLLPDGDGLWLVAAGAGGLNDVAASRLAAGDFDANGDCRLLPGIPASALQAGDGRPAAIAAVAGGVVLQTQAPFGLAWAPGGGVVDHVVGPPGVGARGVALLHAAPIGTVACASCHPEGGEDGRTWRFERDGAIWPRRTQPLVGAVDTPPLHWDGEHADLAALLVDSFEARIGGVLEEGDVDAVAEVIGALAPPNGAPVTPDRSVGEAAFARSGCEACHGGPWLTDGLAHDVGRRDAAGQPIRLHTPPLRGVGVRGPWMHDGCARTLEERFDPACGGDAHGAVDPADVPALVALLRTL